MRLLNLVIETKRNLRIHNCEECHIAYIFIFLRKFRCRKMELTEKERLMLVEKKEEIRKLTLEILDIANDPRQATEIKKKIASILSILSTIGSYAKPKEDLTFFTRMADLIFYEMSLLDPDTCSPEDWIYERIEEFCIYVNSVQFEFTKTGLKIRMPKISKIEFSIFKQSQEHL